MKLFKNKIKELVYDGHIELAKYYAINLKSIFNYYTSKFLNKHYKKIHLNFLITSNAEVRIFKPLILSILNRTEFEANVFYLDKFKFNSDFEVKINQSHNVSISYSVFPIVKSFKHKIFLNIICLDHCLYQKQHSVGVNLITYIRKQMGKTICIQHGGTQQDNINGHQTSQSQYQIVFGDYIYTKLTTGALNKDLIFLTGNPLHDGVFSSNKTDAIFPTKASNIMANKEVITLITCLHTEYEDRSDPNKCYIDYINKIYRSIDFSKYHLVVKMHPNDTIKPNIYRIQLTKCNITENNVTIIEPNTTSSVYDCISISDLIISRSSTVMEESLLLKKKIIAFDLFLDGPSRHYDHLLRYSSYKKVIGIDKDLAAEIDKSIVNYNFEETEHSAIVKDFTFKLDNNSVDRILDVFRTISEV